MPANSTDSPLKQICVIKSGGCGKVRCEPGWEWQPRMFVDYDLWYAVSGKGEMHVDGRKYPVRAGSCFLLRPGDRLEASQHPDDRLTVIFIHFSLQDMHTGGSVRLSTDDAPARCTVLDDPYRFETMLEATLEIAERGGLGADEEFDARMRLLLLQLYRLQQSGGESQLFSLKQRHAVSKVISRIREEGGRRIPYEDLASSVGLAPSYLSVLFKKVTGQSLKSYFTKVRMERAMHLLTETTMNVSQVSYALEYANVYLFSKQFKSYFGQPPSRFALRSSPARPIE